ncbi:MAG: hypothetical protein KDJ16_11915 [Hyphomicrobiales bacterium]|nr:hypothetical protein [Hyphomicrobiales bacterium]
MSGIENLRARRSTLVFTLIAGLGVALAGTMVHARLSGAAAGARLEETGRLVAALGLSDLALFTEARYTRHPTMADLHTPFQDHPVSFEHFPSGTLVPPPSGIDSGRLTDKEPRR